MSNYYSLGKIILSLIVVVIFTMPLYLPLYASDFKSSTRGLNCGKHANTIVKKYYPNYTIAQLKDLDKDLQEYFTDTFGDAHPGCIEEDFDGDGVTDYALLLLSESKVEGKLIEKLIVLRGKGEQKFIPIELEEVREVTGSSFVIRNSFIRHIPPGKIKEWDSNRTLTIKNPGFESVLFEAASRVYFWETGKFHFIQTSD